MALTDSHHEREPMKMQIKWWWWSELFDTDDDQVMIINLLTGLHSVFHVCLCASAHLQQLKWAAAIFCEYHYDQDSDDADEEDNDDYDYQPWKLHFYSISNAMLHNFQQRAKEAWVRRFRLLEVKQQQWFGRTLWDRITWDLEYKKGSLFPMQTRVKGIITSSDIL